MIVNSINNRINPTIILANNMVSNVELLTAKPNHANSDSLQKQMSFMGLLNLPFFKCHSNSAKPVPTKLLDKYLASMEHIDLGEQMTLLRLKNNNKFNATPIVLLKTPMSFYDSLKALKFNGYYSETSFGEYKEAIQKTPDLKCIFIRGIVGQGSSSTAFLTESGNVIKMSKTPNFPSQKEFIKNLEVPILNQHIVELQNGKKIYCVEEMFTEDASIRGITLEEYNVIFDKFSEKLKKANSSYTFWDFKRNNPIYFDQLGFIDDIPYLIDHECIRGRELVK